MAAPSLSNYKSGISVAYENTLGNPAANGSDYVEEYVRESASRVKDDFRCLYARSSVVRIALSHNAYNYYFSGAEGGIWPDSSTGIIRYRLDKEPGYGELWGSSDATERTGLPLLPAYSVPIDLSAVAGQTGTVGVETDKLNFQRQGLLDEFGEEWHVLAWGDDDVTALGLTGSNKERGASDGKWMPICLDPQLPVITFEESGSGTFYTRPPKAYLVPKIWAHQTTYVRGTVSFELWNLTDMAAMEYRIDNGLWMPYVVAVSTSGWAQGSHQIDFRRVGTIPFKSRTVIVDPPSPSAGEPNKIDTITGSSAETANLLTRISSGGATHSLYQTMKSHCTEMSATVDGSPYIHNTYDRNNPAHESNGCAHYYALVAWVEGLAASDAGETYANAALRHLCLSAIWLPEIGVECLDPWDPAPCRPRRHRGYHDANDPLQIAFAYAILSTIYLESHDPAGLKPIDEIHIRDKLAWYGLEALMHRGNWADPRTTFDAVDLNGEIGMWSTARDIAAAWIAALMPSYKTDVYGTSGFDNVTTPGAHTPFSTQAISWRNLFLDWIDNDDAGNQARLLPYPQGMTRLFNFWNRSALVQDDGNWKTPIGYSNPPQMGHVLECWWNFYRRVAALPLHANMISFLERRNNGTLDSVDDAGVQAYFRPNPGVVNSHCYAASSYQNSIPEGALYNIENPPIGGGTINDDLDPDGSFDEAKVLFAEGKGFSFFWYSPDDAPFSADVTPPSVPQNVSAVEIP